MLSGDSARLDFAASHYWDNFDFTDKTWIADTTAFEAAFYGWTDVLVRLPEPRAAELTGRLIRRIAARVKPAGNGEGSKNSAAPAGSPDLPDLPDLPDSPGSPGSPGPAGNGKGTEVSPDPSVPLDMLLRFADVSEYYFAHPNSPFRNEELYIPVLRAVIEAPCLDDIYKIRPRAQLESALKNRPGMRAADVAYTTECPGAGSASARKGRLSQLKADYVLLMFYNPDCQDCARVEQHIVRSEVFAPLVASGSMKVLAVYVDEDIEAWRKHLPQMPAGWTVGYNTTIRSDHTYELPAIPNLYLLDKDKRVVFKDALVEQIEEYLNGR